MEHGAGMAGKEIAWRCATKKVQAQAEEVTGEVEGEVTGGGRKGVQHRHTRV